ncbi:DUF349 domain-containing protein [Spirosoma utsteinense]|uniref:DUF349 domain-containing protein n=1 Tax=Spirosoma utsteinense TaxID=2585773 RepID=A0ABR6W910_9BACT|nr:DUF349 domain-containing protein [Spirosoma utsteinense]MBC3787375.1 hypothetical protein [Spirosoma utsteinense]MBC3793071.1 hypothetical protein [Spirosoma utsteinense]
MANEEQEINQQPDNASPLTDALAVNTPEETANTAEATEPTATDAVESQSDTSSGDTTAMPESADQTPAAEPTEEPQPVAAIDQSEPTADVGETADVSQETSEAETPVAEPTAETPASDAPEEAAPVEAPSVSEEVTAQYADVADESEEEAQAQPAVDYSQFSKQDFVTLLETKLASISGTTVSPGDFKKADQTLKDVKPLFDQMKRAEREVALQGYVAETGSEEGFEFKNDETVQQFDELYKQIKSQKNTYFQNLDKAKDGNFAAKTELLTRLRVLVETDENNAGDPKTSWNEFKKIQDEWKAAGNMNSPHNATLWATYHALVDRYYSNRNIYFELKELDRKRNITLKTDVIEKVEAMAKASEETPVTRQTIDDANALFEEYKHIGPAPKAEQEVLWARMKAALDVLYDKRRGQTNEQRKESAQLYEEKSAIYEELVPLTSFASNSINDWNDKTKAVMALQDRWNGIKGPMPREEGKELSKKFWAALKTFFHNKGEFFKQLESKREENLRAKTELCEQVEAILASGEESPETTQTVIELQRQWKNIGQVPEKQKNSIFDRFKAACDAFFNKKRSKNQDTEREFEGNLTQKITLIERIEAAATENADLSQLNEFKKEWSTIGFVPKKDMQSTQKRYINAVNALVSATGKIPAKDKERIMLQSEAEATRGSGPRNGGRDGDRGGRQDRGGDRGFSRDRDDRGDRDYNRGGTDTGNKRENDIRRRMTAIENDIATYRNNIEFFARSKNADQLRADIDKKIADAQKQLDELKHQLKVAQA